jgi:hypothetical protein
MCIKKYIDTSCIRPGHFEHEEDELYRCVARTAPRHDMLHSIHVAVDVWGQPLRHVSGQIADQLVRLVNKGHTNGARVVRIGGIALELQYGAVDDTRTLIVISADEFAAGESIHVRERSERVNRWQGSGK